MASSSILSALKPKWCFQQSVARGGRVDGAEALVPSGALCSRASRRDVKWNIYIWHFYLFQAIGTFFSNNFRMTGFVLNLKFQYHSRNSPLGKP